MSENLPTPYFLLPTSYFPPTSHSRSLWYIWGSLTVR